MSTLRIPNATTPLSDLKTGRPTPAWYVYFSFINEAIGTDTGDVGGQTLLTPGDMQGLVQSLVQRVSDLEGQIAQIYELGALQRAVDDVPVWGAPPQ